MIGKIDLLATFAATAGIANAVMAVGGVISGIWLFWWGPGHLDAANTRDEFAEGMLVGGLAETAWLVSALLIVLTLLCWRTFRHARSSREWRRIDSIALVFELMPIAVAAYTLLFEL